MTRKASLNRRCLIRDGSAMTDGAVLVSDRGVVLAEGTANTNPETDGFSMLQEEKGDSEPEQN